MTIDASAMPVTVLVGLGFAHEVSSKPIVVRLAGAIIRRNLPRSSTIDAVETLSTCALPQRGPRSHSRAFTPRGLRWPNHCDGSTTELLHGSPFLGRGP